LRDAGGRDPRDLVIMYPSDICALKPFPSWTESGCMLVSMFAAALQVAGPARDTEYRGTASWSGGKAVKW
jgi:hypothetical protein